MKQITRGLTCILLAMAVAACSSKGSVELEPMKLESFKAEIELRKEWSVSVGNGQGKLWNKLVPAVDGDQIFAAGSDGVVVALDRFTGKRQWQKKLKADVSGGVGAGYGLVLVGTMSGEVIALDSRSGDEVWRTNLASEILAAPATNGDVVVVQTQDDRLIALEAYNGAERWMYEERPAVLSLRGTSLPLITPYVVYAGLSSGKVVAVELQQGLPLWEQRVAIPTGRTELERMVDVDGRLMLKGGVLYVVAFQGRAAGLDEQTGGFLWQRDASSYVGVAQGFGTAYVSLADGQVESIDERSGAAVWTNDKLLRRQLSGPAVFSSYVAVGDMEGYLHVLSQVDGRFVARTRIDSAGVRVQPLVVGGWMYAFGNDGKLVALTIK